MSGISKRVNGSWASGSYSIMKTATDTLTTLPADVYADGTAATIGLVGNMSQTGTPTPQNPIQPQECGERTGQLFDENYPNMKVDTPTYRSIYVGDGTFTLSTTTVQHGSSANLFFLAGNVGSGASTQNNGIWNGNPRTVTAVDGYVTIAYRYYTNEEASDPRSNDVMLNTGSTALPYEPYGYKIPISSANTTTPVYLGEVETTRRIKKLVLTGEENIIMPAVSSFQLFGVITWGAAECICSHYKSISFDAATRALETGCAVRETSSGEGDRFRICDLSYTDIDTFKAYLAQQYSAGTPVCVWYVLAEPETGIVNEPLRKIGDYADTVSGITIPTIAGADSFDVLTTLKPSEVTANYHGWHTGTVHERESGQWD